MVPSSAVCCEIDIHIGLFNTHISLYQWILVVNWIFRVFILLNFYVELFSMLRPLTRLDLVWVYVTQHFNFHLLLRQNVDLRNCVSLEIEHLFQELG